MAAIMFVRSRACETLSTRKSFKEFILFCSRKRRGANITYGSYDHINYVMPRLVTNAALLKTGVGV